MLLVLSVALLAGVAGLWALTIAGGSATYVPQSRRFCLSAMNGAVSAIWPDHAFAEPKAADAPRQYPMWGELQGDSVAFFAASGLKLGRRPIAGGPKTAAWPDAERLKGRPNIVIVSCPLWLPVAGLALATWRFAVSARRRK